MKIRTATMTSQLLSILLLVFMSSVPASADREAAADEDPHPDPNEEDYSGMAYVGRMDENGRRVGFDMDNGASSCCW
jgi:hypothetical protein